MANFKGPIYVCVSVSNVANQWTFEYQLKCVAGLTATYGIRYTQRALFIVSDRIA